jgi:NAD(P)-dependent dehydrogenase (short-subunit alcohol dehydrogenase family)
VKILIIGASGLIGTAVAAALAARHTIISASRSAGDHRVDLGDKASTARLLATVGPVDAIVAVAGHAAWNVLQQLTDADFEASLRNKLMAQVNLVRLALPFLDVTGSLTLTGGTYSREPTASATAVALTNAALEGFAIAAALDLPHGPRVNVVTPPIVGDLRVDRGRVVAMPATDVALAYVASVEGHDTGKVIDARLFADLSRV